MTTQLRWDELTACSQTRPTCAHTWEKTLESDGSSSVPQPASAACGALSQPTSVQTMERLRRRERLATPAAAARMPASMTAKDASCQGSLGVGGLPLPM
jgi:hypothetical protein